MTETYEVALPAVRIHRPVSYMAALGTLRLLAEEAGHRDVRLHWDQQAAVVTSRLPDLDAIAAELHGVIDRMPGDAVIPGVEAWWPPGKRTPGVKGDPAQAWPPLHPERLDWWYAVLTDHDGESVRRTPYIARRGQQTIRSFFAKPLQRLRGGETDLAAALRTGHRVPGYTGELLDAGAHDSDGGVAGSPGLTWLAAMSLPLLGPVTIERHRPRWWEWLTTAPGWIVQPVEIMAWPLWSMPLPLAAVRVMTTHPAWMPAVGDGGSPVADPEALRSVRVDAVYTARRRPVGRYDWPLTPSGQCRMLSGAVA